MEHLIEVGIFFLKTTLIVLAVIILVSYILAASMKSKFEDKNKLKLKNKSKELEARKKKLNLNLADPKTAKTIKKQEKKSKKQEKKKPKEKPRLFVLDFNGDIKASQAENLSQEITSLIQVCKPKKDEVILRLESPGGMVSGYGLAASELMRLKSAGIRLTVAVDKVAASGGYMMACVADQILAAPFAIIGSIGVVAQMPNFNKLLKKNHIDFEVLTAGDYKRTLTMFGENTEKGREKFVGQLEDIHKLFKDFITQNRPQVDLAKVATGEFWFGNQCQELKLIDGVSTSEDYLLTKNKDFEVFELSTEKNKSIVEKVTEPVSQMLGRKISDLSLWNGL